MPSLQEKDEIWKMIELLKGQLIETAKKSGYTHPDTIHISQLLDHNLNEFRTVGMIRKEKELWGESPIEEMS